MAFSIRNDARSIGRSLVNPEIAFRNTASLTLLACPFGNDNCRRRRKEGLIWCRSLFERRNRVTRSNIPLLIAFLEEMRLVQLDKKINCWILKNYSDYSLNCLTYSLFVNWLSSSVDLHSCTENIWECSQYYPEFETIKVEINIKK